MKLEKVITLANESVRILFLAMVRSLRATECELPVCVIPYDDRRFELPEGCQWWEIREVLEWLDTLEPYRHSQHLMRKYQCLLTENYQFIDSDAIFLRDPEAALAPHSGFITSCGHWHSPVETFDEYSFPVLRERTTVWQASVFNTGQFACDRRLYDFQELKETAEDARHRRTVLENPFHEQPGLNLLVNLKCVSVTNLTLPPNHMESTWANDYPDEFECFWSETGGEPYLIHWAGRKADGSRPIDQLFFKFLSLSEKGEYLGVNSHQQSKEIQEMSSQPHATFHAAYHPAAFHSATYHAGPYQPAAFHPETYHAGPHQPAAFHPATYHAAGYHSAAFHPAVYDALISGQHHGKAVPLRVQQSYLSAIAQFHEATAKVFSTWAKELTEEAEDAKK